MPPSLPIPQESGTQVSWWVGPDLPQLGKVDLNPQVAVSEAPESVVSTWPATLLKTASRSGPTLSPSLPQRGALM